MSARKPTFVLVHGAWHTPAHWGPLIDALAAHGYKIVAPALPSVSRADVEPPPDNLADIAAVRQSILAELDLGHDVIVVPHSYGGMPAAGAIKDLDQSSRRTAGFDNGVVAIAPIVSYVVPAGLSLFEAEDKPAVALADLPPILKPMSAEVYYHDMPVEERDQWHKLLGNMSSGALFDKSRFSAHEVVPVHFLLATDDRAMVPTTQQRVVQLMRDRGATVRTETLEGCGHSPFFSRVDETVAFLRRSAGEQI